MPILFPSLLGLAVLAPAAAHAEDAGDAEAKPAGQTTEQPAEAPAEASADQPLSLTKAIDLPGIAPKLELTSFVQGKVSGDGDESVRFTGRADLFVDFSSDGLGLWEGTVLRTHTELRYNDTNALGVGGALWPQNIGAAVPITGQGIELTSIHIAQNLGPKTNLLVGKINALDLLEGDPFFGGRGVKRFTHFVFAAPPSGVVPPVIMGGILLQQAGDVGITLMVYDPEDRTGDYWVDGLFATGVNASLSLGWKGDWGGRATSLTFTATGSTKTGADFEDILAPPGLEGGTKKGSFNLAVQFGHDLKGSVKAPSHLGVYFKSAIADGNPNLIQASFIGGLAGHGLFEGRSRDGFGIGVYYYNFSDVLQDATDPLGEFDDEAGMEAFYDFALGGNVNLGFHAQIIDPARGDFDIATILGARLGFHF